MREWIAPKPREGAEVAVSFWDVERGPSCKVVRGWVHQGLCNLKKVKRKLTEGTGENFSYKIDEEVAYAKIVQK
jgi:hypothetical protein